MNNNDNQHLFLTVRSRTKVEYQGIVNTVSSYNDKGPFDVLNSHANFITLINNSLIIDQNLSSRKYIKIDKGVLSVSNNIIEVYAGI
jgi:F0F1-type ATP synthase epsilon subunit